MQKKTQNTQKFYVTTPIYYVNAAPHVGSLYTTLAADVLARYYRSKYGDKNVFFLTGTDEHGQKVAEYAEKAGKQPQEFADSVVPEFERAWEITDISYDHFMRTTDPRHIKEAQKIFTKIYEAGYIYKGTYEGLYCVGCEKFITEAEMVNDKCHLHPDKNLVEQKEDNYFFKLSKFADVLLKKIQNNEYRVLPERRRNEIIARIEQGIEDISISRESVSWGIPVPWDESHTFYVWVEALFNYFTATQFLDEKEDFWPAQVHFLAKDIIWFHAFVWQALLLAADLPLPETIFAHGFFTINGQKMSKSLGNVIAPSELVEKYGVDGARYLLLSAYQFGNDGDLSMEAFDARYNADLANGLGNLVARSAKLVEGQPGFDMPDSYSESFAEHVENFRFDKALVDVWDRIAEADKYLNEKEPWTIKDDVKKRTEVMRPVIEALVQIAYDVKPFMPRSSANILTQLTAETIQTADPYFARV